LQAECDAAQRSLSERFASEKSALAGKFESSIETMRKTAATASSDAHRVVAAAQQQAERIAQLESQGADLRGRIQQCEADRRAASSRWAGRGKREAAPGIELSAVKARLSEAEGMLDEGRRREDATGSPCQGIRVALVQKELALGEALAQAEALAHKAAERDWIAKGSREVIMKAHNKVKAASDELSESRRTCRELGHELTRTRAEERDAGEDLRRMGMILEREKCETEKTAEEGPRLAPRIEKLEVDLATERQHAGFLQGQPERREGFNAFICRATPHESSAEETASRAGPDRGPSPSVGPETRSIIAAFLESSDTVQML